MKKETADGIIEAALAVLGASFCIAASLAFFLLVWKLALWVAE